VGALNNNNMIKFALIGAALVVVTVIIHAVGTTWWLRVLGRRYTDSDGMVIVGKSAQVLIGTVLALLVLHTIEIVVWAYAYLVLLPSGELASFEEAVYFSFVTFTTLGYGDITLTENWRLLSGIEALNGIMLVGWTTAMLFAVVQRTWQGMAHRIRGNTPEE
jgi:voltage-gated potassium channel